MESTLTQMILCYRIRQDRVELVQSLQEGLHALTDEKKDIKKKLLEESTDLFLDMKKSGHANAS
jgi:hypothetical protein